MHSLSYPVLILLSLTFLVGCNSNNQAEPEYVVQGRWFSKQQFETGKVVYAENCARCHGTYGQSTVANWKKPNPDGSFPPPPLNGSAHTWHHPFEVLVRTIDEGGAPVGGTMPAFGDSLSDEEKIAVIAYIQSLWDNKTYERWVDMNARQ
ncbi:cytochrome c [Balneolaceae bacterium YR4-1]|uniref:Cytochrome c n=1 Tax=Halalkalibaculum roseum TaxID=2709311 RepID=A0A6M1SKD8_9BACT|nr:cytochrome c [Halalkalibaculum roseum]NGP75509.1 cytochrome c [Halalkalibaculum roseum]